MLMRARKITLFLSVLSIAFTQVPSVESVAQSVSKSKPTIIATYKIVLPDGKITLTQEAKQFFAWLASQPDAVGFLMSLGYNKWEASAFNQLANASVDGQLAEFFDTETGQRFIDHFFFFPWLIDMTTDALSKQSEEDTKGGGAQSGTPNPCGKPPGLIDKGTSDKNMAAVRAAGEKYQAGLSSNVQRENARFVGSVIGGSIGGAIGGRVAVSSFSLGLQGGAAGLLAGAIIATKGSDLGGDVGIIVYEEFTSEEENVSDQIERANAEVQAASDRAQSFADKAQKDADEAGYEADAAQRDANAWKTVASNAQKKADESGDSNDQKTADEMAKTAAEKQAYADKKKKDAADAATRAKAAKEVAEKAKKEAEERKKNANKTKSGTMPVGDGQGEVESSPWGMYVQARILEHHLRVLEMMAKGEDPTTILINPYADPSSGSSSKAPKNMNAEELKLPLDPVGTVASSNVPCFDMKFEMAPEDGLSPTVVNPPIYGDPKGDGVPSPPGSPLKR